MKIKQVLTTQIYVPMTEIPNIPVGFKLTGAKVTNNAVMDDHDRFNVILEGEIHVKDVAG